MVSRKHLSDRFFHLAETFDIIWQDLNTARRVVEACCVLSDDAEYASRAILLVFRLLRADFRDRGISANTSGSDLLEHAHKDAADGSMQLARHCFEIGIRPDLLYSLLKWIARHAHGPANESLLQWLPALIQHDLDLVWDLLDFALADATPGLWSKTEKVLYYTYYQHFDKVNLRLTRLEAEAMEEDSAEMFGRILTLAHLADHVTKDDLFDRLRAAHSSALKGAADVLGTNISQRTQKCTQGALRLLQLSELTSDAWSTLARKVLNQDNLNHASVDLIDALLASIPDALDRLYLRNLGDWIAELSKKNPTRALSIIEEVISAIESNNRFRSSIQHEPIAQAVLEVLREADMFGSSHALCVEGILPG
jgi:hypothetical protein